MKKISIALFIMALLAVCCSLSEASGGVFSDSFMELDVRDANNNSLENRVVFYESTFSKAMAMFSSFGSCRWQNKPIDNPLSLTSKNVFKLPVITSSFLYGSRRVRPEFSEFIVSKKISGIMHNCMPVSFVILLICFFLPSGEEPRFQIPVFLE